MDIQGEYHIAAPPAEVWQQLIDPDVLSACIPGCESMEKINDTEFAAKVMAAIGPVRARFDTNLALEDLVAPHSYTLVGSGKGGAAGFGSGSAEVRLDEFEGGTRLTYNADFKVGGKLAQVGSRLVMSATRKMADDFFGNLSLKLDPNAQRIGAPEKPAATLKIWLAVIAVIVALMIAWFLFR